MCLPSTPPDKHIQDLTNLPGSHVSQHTTLSCTQGLMAKLMQPQPNPRHPRVRVLSDFPVGSVMVQMSEQCPLGWTVGPQDSCRLEYQLDRTTSVLGVSIPSLSLCRARCLLPGPLAIPRAYGISVEDLGFEISTLPPSSSSHIPLPSPSPGTSLTSSPFVREPGLNGAPPTQTFEILTPPRPLY
jgi:hypothetical protein